MRILNAIHAQVIGGVNKQIYDRVISSGFPDEKVFILPNAIKVSEKYVEKSIAEVPVIGM